MRNPPSADGYQRLAEAITNPDQNFIAAAERLGIPRNIAKDVLLPARNGMKQTPLKRTAFGEAKRATYVAERDFQNMVEELAAYCGWTTFHLNMPMRSPAGFPDLVMFRERIVFAELKVRRPRDGRAGKLMPAQIEYAHTIQRAGGEYYSWLFPDDWDAVKLALAKPGQVIE